jgi:hypothetical protein
MLMIPAATGRRGLALLVSVLLAPAAWLERARGRKRLALGFFYALIIVGCGVLLWRQSRLLGLPKIADPFDTRPLLALAVPEDENAFVLYREAKAKSRRSEGIERRIFNTPYAWPARTDTEALDYLAHNADALELWRRGSERPDALYIPIGKLSFDVSFSLLMDHRHFTRMALVTASKAKADGDMAGAWIWYRTILRGSRLIGRHTIVIASIVGTAEYTAARPHISTWAADPRVDAKLLRRALDDLLAINALTAPNSEPIQVEYISSMRALKEHERMLKYFLDDPWSMNFIDKTFWFNNLEAVWRARWFVQHEPERARRIFRLTFANWLSQCEKPPSARAPMIGTKRNQRLVYDTPFVTPEARGVLPAALVEQIESSQVASALLMGIGGFDRSFDRDRTQRAGLVLELARQLYARDHNGKLPDSDDVLVGPYLKRLPEGAAILSPGVAGALSRSG